MSTPYFVALDIHDQFLKENAINHLFNTSFIDRLAIIEEPTSWQHSHRYDLVVFDHQKEREEIIEYCRHRLEHSPKTIFIHISEETPIRCDHTHLVGISKLFFDEYFMHLTDLCFFTYSVRESVNEIKDLLIAGDQ